MRYLVRRDLFVGDEGRASIIQDMVKRGVINKGDGGKVYAIFKYLYTNTTRNGTVSTTLKAIVEGCGYKPRGGKYNMNNQFKTILCYLANHGYIGKNGYDFSDVSLNEYLIIPVDNLLDVGENGVYKNFITLGSYEEEVIRDIKGVDNNTLEAYFLTYKVNSNRNLPSIVNDISISANTARHYRELLVDARLMKSEETELNEVQEKSISVMRDNEHIIIDFVKSAYDSYTKEGENIKGNNFYIWFDLETTDVYHVPAYKDKSRIAVDEQFSDKVKSRIDKGYVIGIANFPLGNEYKGDYISFLNNKIPIIDRMIAFYIGTNQGGK